MYQPLDPWKSEIRALKVLAMSYPASSRRDEPIQCIMEHINLYDDPVYDALSYTWNNENLLGDDFLDPDEPDNLVLFQGFVLLNGRNVRITGNLWTTLWHFRRNAQWVLEHPDAQTSEFNDYEYLHHKCKRISVFETPLWVDALCINQSDSLEKSHQVRMMASIYAEADLCMSGWARSTAIPDA